MEDIKINQLPSGTPSLDDTILGIRASGGYQALVSDVAKKIIEDYAGSSIGGASQSIASAIASLGGGNNFIGANSYYGWTQLVTGQDLNTVTTVGIYVANSDSIAGSLLNCPTSGLFKMTVEYIRRDGRIKQTINGAGNGNHSYFWHRISTDNGATWTNWFVLPIHSEVNAIANAGAKNLLPMKGTTMTLAGVTFTVNSDGSVHAEGTATGGNATFYFSNPTSATTIARLDTTEITPGTYTLTGCPANGSASTYCLSVQMATGSSTTLYRDTGEGKTVVVTESQDGYRPYIVIYEGTTVDLTFYPMLRKASIQDNTYVPYGMSNAELTERVNVRGLPNGVDLNDCTEDGRYVSPSSSNTQTLLNRPNGLGNGFSMQVYSESVNVTQVIYESGLNPKIYIRSKISSSWGTWKIVTLADA